MKITFFSRSLATGLLCLSSIPALHAQNHKFEIGLTGGPNITTILENKPTEPGYIPVSCGLGGLSFQYNISRIFSVHADLVYERKGVDSRQVWTRPSSVVYYDLVYKDRLDYLTLPVMLRAGIGNRIRGFASAGLYIGYRINSTSDRFDNIEKTEEHFRRDDIKKTDLGFAAGLGVAVRAESNISLSFEARESMSVLNISEDDRGIDYQLRNNAVSFLFGVAYRFKRF